MVLTRRGVCAAFAACLHLGQNSTGNAEGLPLSDWTPTHGFVAFSDSRDIANVSLIWDAQPSFAAFDGIEIEFVLPDIKRKGTAQFDPENLLKQVFSVKIPVHCRYRDVAFRDKCESWAMGIATGCLDLLAPG